MEPREYETLASLEDRFWWYRGLHRLVLDRIAELFPSAPRSILDAGCGTGGMLRRLARRYSGAALIGIDWSPHAVAHASRGTRCSAKGELTAGPGPRRVGGLAPVPPNARGVALARASVSELPFTNEAFEVVVSLDVLYHTAVPNDVAALRELGRVLRPGGVLVLNLPAFESLRSSHDRAIHTARRYRQGEVTNLLVQAGLEPVRVHYWNGLLFPALAAVRRVRRKLAQGDRPVAPSDVRPLPWFANRSLELALALERAWLRVAGLPFGLSVLAVARRPARSDLGLGSSERNGNPVEEHRRWESE